MKTFAVAMFAGVVVVNALDCPEGTLYMSTSMGCGCKFPEIMKFNAARNTCECLDDTLTWGNNGESCGLKGAQKTAAVQWIRSRWQPFNDAGTRRNKDLAYVESLRQPRIVAATAERDAKLKVALYKWKMAAYSWYSNFDWHRFYSARSHRSHFHLVSKKYYQGFFKLKEWWKLDWAKVYCRQPMAYFDECLQWHNKFYYPYWHGLNAYNAEVAGINKWWYDTVEGIKQEYAPRDAFVNATYREGKILDNTPWSDSLAGIADALPQRASVWRNNPYPWRHDPINHAGTQYHSRSPNNAAGFPPTGTNPWSISENYQVFSKDQLQMDIKKVLSLPTIHS